MIKGLLRSKVAIIVTMILAVAINLIPVNVFAASTTLCSGSSYSTCINAGFSAHDYNLHNGTSYWTMYAGHNCTNYAAYMAIKNGSSTPSQNLGSALTWDTKAAQSGFPVNGTAAVGAIAQWEANAGPASSSGHVAYVEQVASNYIIVSEDNWGGPFSWRKITANSPDWPSNFIHFADVVPPSTPTTPPQNNPILRQVVVRNANNIWANTAANTAWQNISNTATAGFWTVSGDRIVLQDTNGLWVRDGNTNWVRWGNGDSHEVQASANRIVVRNGTNLWTTTAANVAWQLISNTATEGSWKLSGDRIALRDDNGLWVKDGNAGWVRWGNPDLQEIQLSGSRVVVRNENNLWSTTAANVAWQNISNTATEGFWKLSGDRVVVQDPNGLWVRDGDTSWVRWGNGDSHEIQVSSNRLVVRNGTNIWTTTAANIAWELVSNTATEGFWKLSHDRIVLQDTNGLWVRDGNTNWVRWGNGDSHEVQISKD